MISFSLRDASLACGGVLAGIGEDTLVRGFSTDSRKVHPGDLFFALQGDRFDAHQFLTPEWLERGACCVVTPELLPVGLPDFPRVEVPDVRKALGRVAQMYRRRFNVPVIGITGSNGKTSTKALLKAAMSEDRAVLASPASFNNDVGVPLTLLEMDPAHEAAILEIGTNHPGEIAHLTRMVEPTMGVITSIGGSHVGHFGSVDAIAEEKGWLAELLPANGTLFLNADSPWSESCARRASAKVIRVGFSDSADWRLDACDVQSDRTCCSIRNRAGDVQTKFQIPVPGRHQAINAGLAFAAAFQNGVSVEHIVQGLRSAEMPSMRMQAMTNDRFTVWNDAYNANEDSVVAAMDTFAAISAKASRKVMVLGELNELGDHAEGVYQRLAVAASRYGFDLLVGIGHGPDQWVDQLNQKHGSCCLSYEHVEEAIEKLPSHLVPGDHLLIKASRGARLERLAEALLADHEDSKVGGETKKLHHDPTSGMSGPSVRKVLAGAVSAGLGGMIS